MKYQVQCTCRILLDCWRWFRSYYIPNIQKYQVSIANRRYMMWILTVQLFLDRWTLLRQYQLPLIFSSFLSLTNDIEHPDPSFVLYITLFSKLCDCFEDIGRRKHHSLHLFSLRFIQDFYRHLRNLQLSWSKRVYKKANDLLCADSVDISCLFMLRLYNSGEYSFVTHDCTN